MERKFEKKLILITGGASGIGRSTSLVFAREGATVIIADILVEEGEMTAHMIEKEGGNALFIKTDVSKSTDVENMFDKTIRNFENLDFAFNNAGIPPGRVGAPITEQTEEDFDQVIRVNLKGVWLCMKHELLRMQKQGKGAIVNCSSIAGLVGNVTDTSAYVASKHGVQGLSKAAALEFAKSNIRVNAVCPGFIRTPMLEDAFKINPQIEDRMKQRVPMKRAGTSEEIAEVVAWLCSDSAGYITGQSIVVDGGLLIL